MTATTVDAAPELVQVLSTEAPLAWSFIGDSVTAAGWHTWGSRGYSELFHERLREVGRTRDGVVTTAVSGWQVGNLLAELDAVCLRYRPDIVLIGTGLNDTKGTTDGVHDFARRYTELVHRLRAETGALVVAQTPNDTLTTGPDHVVAHLAEYVEAIRGVAAETGAVLVDHYAVWQATEVNSVYHWLGHGCHPNAYGHRAMARTLLQACGLWDPLSRSGRLTIP
ncbi:SGNH/GDSL hydrolase family protein [Ruania alba]|uniref:Lysophospholipase L1 n=1 Tax=Ruania alba TaxID=648782 RepID=A0A1H5MQK5_9MICO|nr:SGNH/GDSL hydrolase family protein [Ruania alba]SEE91665.1 Lysophospholipase L1 [Ruania alba]